MKLRHVSILALLLLAAVAHGEPTQEAYYAARVMTKVDDGMEKARTHRDRPDWYVQCQIDLSELTEAVQKLPEAARAPYLAKIKDYRPEIEAGVRLSRGMHVARRIRDILDSAKEDLARVPIDQTIFDDLDRHFAEPDAKGIPADQLKALQAEYAELKKASELKKKQ